jgi:hypothetical protein
MFHKILHKNIGFAVFSLWYIDYFSFFLVIDCAKYTGWLVLCGVGIWWLEGGVA